MKNRLLSTVFCLGLLASPWDYVWATSKNIVQEDDDKPTVYTSGVSEQIFTNLLGRLRNVPFEGLSNEGYMVLAVNGYQYSTFGCHLHIDVCLEGVRVFVSSLPESTVLNLSLMPEMSSGGPVVRGNFFLRKEGQEYRTLWDPFAKGPSTQTFPLGKGDTLSLQTLPFESKKVGSTITRLLRIISPKGLDLLTQDSQSREAALPLPTGEPQMSTFEAFLSQVPSEAIQRDLRRLICPISILSWSKEYLGDVVQQLARIKDERVRAQLSLYADVIEQNFEGDIALSLLTEFPIFAEIQDDATRVKLQRSRLRSTLNLAAPSLDMVFIQPPELSLFPTPLIILGETRPYACAYFGRSFTKSYRSSVTDFLEISLGKTPFPADIKNKNNIAMYVQCLKLPYLKRALEAYAKLTSKTGGETLKALLGAIPDEEIRLALSPFGTPERERELGGLQTPKKAGMFARVISAVLSKNPSSMTIEHVMGLLVGGLYKDLTKASAVDALEEKIASLLLSEDVEARDQQNVSKTTDISSASSSFSYARNTSMRFPTAQPSGAYILCETGTLTPDLSMKTHSVTQLLSLIEAAELRYSPEELERLKTYAMQTPYNSSKKLLPGDLVSFLYHKEATLDGLNALTYAIDRIRREGNTSTVIDCLDKITLSLCQYGGYLALKTLGGIKEAETRLRIKELLDVETLKKLGKQFAFEKLIAHLADLPEQDARRRYLAALIENPQDYPEMRAQIQPLQGAPVLSNTTVEALPMPYDFYLTKETEEFREHFVASLTPGCLEVLRMDSCGTLLNQLKYIKNSEVLGRVMRLLAPSLFKSTGDIMHGGVIKLMAEVQDPILQQEIAKTVSEVGFEAFESLRTLLSLSLFKNRSWSVAHMKILMDLRELGMTASLLKEISLLNGDLLEHRPLLFRGLLRAFGFIPSREDRARLGALVPQSLCLQEGAQLLLPALVRYVSGLPTQEAQTAFVEQITQRELSLTALPSLASTVREDLRDLVASIEDPDIQQSIVHFCQNPQVLRIAGERAPEVVKALMALNDPFCIKDINVCLEDSSVKRQIQSVEDFFLLIKARLQDKESDCFTTLSFKNARRDLIFRMTSFPSINVPTRSTYGTHPGSQGYRY